MANVIRVCLSKLKLCTSVFIWDQTELSCVHKTSGHDSDETTDGLLVVLPALR